MSELKICEYEAIHVPVTTQVYERPAGVRELSDIDKAGKRLVLFAGYRTLFAGYRTMVNGIPRPTMKER